MSVNAQRDDDDLLGLEREINPINIAVSLLRGFLGVPEPRNQQGINPLQLISLANSFLGGGGGGGNQRNSINDEIDPTVQDPRVLKYEEEVNRRNQLGRLARVFTSIFLR